MVMISISDVSQRYRLRFWIALISFGAFVTLFVRAVDAQTAILPTAAERAAYEDGRALGRALYFMKYPQPCTISLLRARCRHDGEVLLTYLQAVPTSPSWTTRLATIRAAFESGDFRACCGTPTIDDIQPKVDQKPGLDRHGLWLVIAGKLTTRTEHDLFSSSHILTGIRTLVEQASDAPTFASAVLAEPLRVLKADSGAVSDTQLAAWRDTMSAGLVRIFPEPAVPHVAYGTGPRADAQLGVALATVSQLADTPTFLVQTESQEFLDETFARLDGYLSPDQHATALQEIRAQLKPSEAPLQPYAAGGPIYRLAALLRGGIERTTWGRVSVGQLSAQIARNAIFHDDRPMNKSMPAFLGTLDGVDSAVPGLKAARAALASADPTNWDDVNRKATAIVDLLMGS